MLAPNVTLVPAGRPENYGSSATSAEHNLRVLHHSAYAYWPPLGEVTDVHTDHIGNGRLRRGGERE